MTRLHRSAHIALITVSLAACSGEAGGEIDPAATYEVYGERFEPASAIPAPAVVAEAEAFVGRSIILEGVASADCEAPGCWTTIDPGDGGQIRIYTSSPDGDTLEVPKSVNGRRIVAAGFLRDATASDSTLSLYVTGVMVEKVRP